MEFFLLSVLADFLGEWIRLPRISFLLLIGLGIGPLGLNIISTNGEHQWLSVAADIALVMVGFMLGGHFTISAIRENGTVVLWFSIAIVISSIVVMFAGLILLGASVEVALI